MSAEGDVSGMYHLFRTRAEQDGDDRPDSVAETDHLERIFLTVISCSLWPVHSSKSRFRKEKKKIMKK